MRLIRQTDQQALNEWLAHLAARSVALDAGLIQTVAAIIDDVRARGDRALIEYTKRFDNVDLRPSELRIGADELRRCAAGVDASVLRALREAIKNVRAFHEHQAEESWTIEPADGILLGQRITPLDSVGLYVPGGTAAYPSSVIMMWCPRRLLVSSGSW